MGSRSGMNISIRMLVGVVLLAIIAAGAFYMISSTGGLSKGGLEDLFGIMDIAPGIGGMIPVNPPLSEMMGVVGKSQGNAVVS